MVEMTFHQVMSVFKVPRDPPPKISYPAMIMDNPAYAIGSFKGFLTVTIDYATWFLESSDGPITDNFLLNRGKVLGRIKPIRGAAEACLRLHVETLQVG